MTRWTSATPAATPNMNWKNVSRCRREMRLAACRWTARRARWYSAGVRRFVKVVRMKAPETRRCYVSACVSRALASQFATVAGRRRGLQLAAREPLDAHRDLDLAFVDLRAQRRGLGRFGVEGRERRPHVRQLVEHRDLGR